MSERKNNRRDHFNLAYAMSMAPESWYRVTPETMGEMSNYYAAEGDSHDHGNHATPDATNA